MTCPGCFSAELVLEDGICLFCGKPITRAVMRELHRGLPLPERVVRRQEELIEGALAE